MTMPWPVSGHTPGLVIVGASQILGDVLDVALLLRRSVAAVLLDQPEALGERDRSLASRLLPFERHGVKPVVLPMVQWQHRAGDEYILGPTSPQKQGLYERFVRHVPDAANHFARLVHPAAVISPTAVVGPGCFVGALSTVASGAELGPHVFINRQASVGHDSIIGDYSRLQPGARVAGLVRVGRGVTLGMGAQVLERVHIGDHAEVAAGALVRRDIPAGARYLGTLERERPASLQERHGISEDDANTEPPTGGSSVGG